MQRSCISRALDAIKRYHLEPEQIDTTILAAINVGLCLESNGADRVAEGFNNDIKVNGRGFLPLRVTDRPPLLPGARCRTAENRPFGGGIATGT
jgi:hypothetical protein